MMKGWIVTIPKTIKWEDYEKELEAVRDGSGVLNYRSRYIPKGMQIGDRMYIVWNGKVRGWMEIVGYGYRGGFVCETTGQHWKSGYYIQRSGEFHKIEGRDRSMTGFRGIRSIEISDMPEIENCDNCYECLKDKTHLGLPVPLTRMILCPICGNKRCPKATDHKLECTGSNESDQPGSRY